MDDFNAGNSFAAFNLLKAGVAVLSLSSKISAMPIILLLVFAEMDEITAVPLLPQPITPILIAEFAFEPKTIPGFKIEKAEIVAALFKNVLLSIIFD